MTSTFARNAISNNYGIKNFLEVDQEGRPLQEQVPRTVDVYSGRGNETIVLPYTNDVVISGALPAGPLVLDASATYNYTGRQIIISHLSTLTGSITLNFGTGNIYSPNAAAPASTYVIPAASLCGSITVDFTGYATCVISGMTGSTPSSGGMISFPINTDVSNELNSGAGLHVQWDTNAPNGINYADFVLIGGSVANSCRDFRANTAGIYEVSYDIFQLGVLASEIETAILVGATPILVTEGVQGLTGHHLSGSAIVGISVGQVISINSVNSSGADAGGGANMVPAAGSAGRINIRKIA